MDKGEFVGREALEAHRGAAAPPAGRVEMTGAAFPRRLLPFLHEAARSARSRAGDQVPLLGKAIALGYVAPCRERAGNGLAVEIRGRAVAAQVVRLPSTARARSGRA
jgi:aminomethyltransferase